MVALLSIGNKLRKIAPLADKADVDEWDRRFIRDMMKASDGGLRTSHLTARQVEHIEGIHAEHFEGREP